MQWYVVKKHINGHYYWYWQKTYREGRHVRTLNKYIGPVGKVSRPIGPRPIAPVVVTPTRIPTLSEARAQIGRLGGYANIDKVPLAQQNAYAATELASSFGLNAEYWYKHATENNIALLPYLRRIDAEEDFDKRRVILNEALDVVAGIKNPAPVITHPDLTGATTIPIPFPVQLNKSVVEFAIKAVTGDVSTTDMDQAWRVKSVSAEIERKKFPKVEEALQRLGVVVQHDDLSGNYFSPSENFINIIPKKCWYATKGNTDIYRYYRTVCHELVHWTGHESRLNRIDFKSWGDKRYALEELTAEMGSVMLLKVLGYQEGESTEYHAAYFSSWTDRFTGNEKQEAIEQAKQRATKAVEYILEHGGIL